MKKSNECHSSFWSAIISVGADDGQVVQKAVRSIAPGMVGGNSVVTGRLQRIGTSYPFAQLTDTAAGETKHKNEFGGSCCRCRT